MQTRAICSLVGVFVLCSWSWLAQQSLNGQSPPGLPPIEPIVSPTPSPLDTPTPAPSPVETPTPPATPDVMETDNDVTVIANGYITTFHGGNLYILAQTYPGPTVSAADPSPQPSATPIVSTAVTVTTISGSPVALGAGVLFVDKAGNTVDPTTVKPGTRMQAIEIVDEVDVGPVVHKIMVDQ